MLRTTREKKEEAMTISYRTRYKVLQRDNFTCQYCGRSAPEVRLEVDHIKPRVSGGRDSKSNLVTCCQSCNRGKGGSKASRNRSGNKLTGEERAIYRLLMKWHGLRISDLASITGATQGRIKGILHVLWEEGLVYRNGEDMDGWGQPEWKAVDVYAKPKREGEVDMSDRAVLW